MCLVWNMEINIKIFVSSIFMLCYLLYATQIFLFCTATGLLSVSYDPTLFAELDADQLSCLAFETY